MTLNSMSMYGIFEATIGAGDAVIVDDLSLVEMTTAELIASRAWGASPTLTAQVGATIPVGVMGGLVVDLDSPSNPQNYVFCIAQRSLWYQAFKVVAGVPTLLFTASIFSPYADGRIIKIAKSGTTYKFYYNNVQVGTDQTISDAAIINNTHHGMFATHPTVQLEDYSIA